MKYSWILISLAAFFLGACEQSVKESTTPSGFKYEHHVKTDGTLPQPGEYAYFHVYMRNPTSGEITYNSMDAPQMPKVAIPDFSKNLPNQKPSPVVEALTLMAVGDSLTVYQSLDTIPNKPMGYQDATSIAYDIVMKEIKSAEEFNAEMEVERKKAMAERERLTGRLPEIEEKVADLAAKYTDGELDSELKTTESGLKYIIHEEGTGPVAKPGEPVEAQYYGVLTDGTMFDNSFKRGRAFSFPVGQGRVIKGWDEGFGMLKEGSKATLFIPSELGYGAAGSPPTIPGGAELIFYVELEKVGN